MYKIQDFLICPTKYFITFINPTIQFRMIESNKTYSVNTTCLKIQKQRLTKIKINKNQLFPS